ncbi:MAG: hypothetical protein H6667_18650 [Ardenticatenaceae bacterium]|nr:hypothetical protein [Ardenticatenaceae bacterium]MCB9446475.1 hypothetical protein [Ardenticatenaceae bacterium]
MTFWQTFIQVIINPLAAFQQFREDNQAARKGLLALLLVLGVYTVILVIFILRDYPALAPSILPIAAEDLYRYQVWYQGPLFFVATLLLTGILTQLTRANGQTERFAVVFARVSFATTVPFALTTMMVELVIAILVLAGFCQPQAVLGWLTGEGALFANAYQLAGILWIIGLLAITARLSVGVRWWLGIVLGVVLAGIYGVPIGLFIR